MRETGMIGEVNESDGEMKGEGRGEHSKGQQSMLIQM